MTRRELTQASIHVVAGHSLVVPLIGDLPEIATCLGRRWRRKRELHLTVVAERRLEALDERGWDRVVRVASGRRLGPVRVGDDIRRVRHPERQELETLVAMAECAGLAELIADLVRATGVRLPVPPVHVTLYSTDPAKGIGITDQRELEELASRLGEPELEEVRRAIGW